MSHSRQRARESAPRPTAPDPKQGPSTPKGRRPADPRGGSDRRRVLLITGTALAAALIGLFVILETSGHGGSASSGGGSGSGAYQVGQPGSGAAAPDFTLQSTAGSTFSLSAQHGKTVLLYFQEGIGCEPCWQQIKDIEAAASRFRNAAIDEVVSITTNSLAQLQQKASDEGISTAVLSDPQLAASHAYNANMYGMMGDGADGHTFVLVGPDGNIRWRADYGGAPNYTMYVPIDQLFRDMGTASHT